MHQTWPTAWSVCDVKTLLSVFLFPYFSSACADINTSEEAETYCKSQSVLFATYMKRYVQYILHFPFHARLTGEYIFQNLFGSLSSGMRYIGTLGFSIFVCL